MKRFRHEKKKLMTMKNDAMRLRIADDDDDDDDTLTQKKKRQKIASQMCVFDWLPDEILEMILEAVPWDLDDILRSVNHRWHSIIQPLTFFHISAGATSLHTKLIQFII